MSRIPDPESFCSRINEPCALVAELRREIDRLREDCKALDKLSHTDLLTGFYNFRHLLKSLDGEMERTKRTDLATALIIIDLDNFKSVNDNYGHEFGNKALQWCARLWRNSIRRIDIPCRYGGEEFAIILPNTPLEGALNVAERLRTFLDHSPLSEEETTLHLTASFGLDLYSGEADMTPEDFIHQTDQYLLQAKQSGKNRVCYDKAKLPRAPTEISPEERNLLFNTPEGPENEESEKQA